jgi:hypothetical protein
MIPHSKQIIFRKGTAHGLQRNLQRAAYLIAGQNLDAPQPATLVVLDVKMIQTTSKLANQKGPANGLPSAPRTAVRTKRMMTLVKQPAIQFVQQSAPITHTFLSEAMLNERVVGSIMQMQKRERSVADLTTMKHSSDVQPPAMKIALERTTDPP